MLRNEAHRLKELVAIDAPPSLTHLMMRFVPQHILRAELTHKVLMNVTKANPLVLEEPAPTVFFLGFGESALDFELRVFVKDRLQRLPLIHELHMAIDRAFREHNIEIAFPQLDIHMRSTDSTTQNGGACAASK